MRIVLLILIAFSLVACARETRQAATQPATGNRICDALLQLDLDGARMTRAESISGGTLDIDMPGSAQPLTVDNLPGFCRVIGEASPVEGSTIGFEAWLPTSDWNRKILMLGNGGYSSSIPYLPMAEYVRRGYVSVATDTGHEGDDPAFAAGRPESIVDWGHRAVHESITHVRKVVTAYFEEAADYTYFAGCSTGGHQALMSAQRYPADFDGIIAGAPGHNRTHLNAGFLWQFLANHRQNDGADPIIPADKLGVISDAVLSRCRDNNGARSGGLPEDPYLDDPLACDFDPHSLACNESDGPDCLTPEQIQALLDLYDGPRNPRTGERIYFGQTPGSEAAGGPPGIPGWSLYWADPRQPDSPARASFWRVWAFDDPGWDWWQFDFDSDMDTVDRRLAATINAMDPGLRAFRRDGGKLIHYHGLNDPVVPATDSISYFSRADAQAGGASDFYRLFLAPGIEHCRGGPGPGDFDLLGALEAWVERGERPDRIVAARHTDGDSSGDLEYTRPLCPYPAYAFYDGEGDRLDAASFDCLSDTPRPPIPQVGADYLR